MKGVVKLLAGLILALSTSGCGTFVAHCIARAPNRYPTWIAPRAPVELAFNPKLLTNFAAQFVTAGPLPARLCYRIVEPADYDLRITSTNWWDHGQSNYEFTFRASVPGQSNQWTASPCGTVFLLHGYGEAQFAMLPWALRLAQAGWRCVLVDLRGHGKSTGRHIYFGVKETQDMTQLLDALARDGQLTGPVEALGDSYGAVLAIRWITVDPRVRSIVAISPYDSLSNAVMNIRNEYADWVPKFMVKAGMKDLPSVLHIPAGEFDTSTVLKQNQVKALFVAGGLDRITPEAEVAYLRSLAISGSELVVVPEATHEALPYYFSVLAPPVLAWLARGQTAP